MINVLSLFDGLGGARIALDELGIECNYYASEIEYDDEGKPAGIYAMKVAKANYPDIIHIGDVRDVKASDLPKIDLLIGGSPCQDLSVAKSNRQGLEGSRSGLFWEYVRLWKELKPKYFVLENVYSMPKESRDIISKTMGVSPIKINAKWQTAQNRERFFWTNTGVWLQPIDHGIVLADIIEEDVDTTGIYTVPRGYNKGGIRITDKAPTLTSCSFGDNNKLVINPVRGVALRTQPRYPEPGVKRTKTVEFRKDNKSNALTGAYTDSMVYSYTYDAIRKFHIVEYERLQGLPDGYCTGKGVSNTQCCKMISNGFAVPDIKHILKEMRY